MAGAYLNPKNGRIHRSYTWCSRCECAELTGSWAAFGWTCPHCRHDAGTARPWEELRACHPEYPDVPAADIPYRWDRSAEAVRR